MRACNGQCQGGRRRISKLLWNCNKYVEGTGFESSLRMRDECIAGDGEGTVDDDGLAEGGRDDVVTSAEGWEHVMVGEFPDWVEPVVFADQGDSAADHDAAWGEQRDDLGQGECKRGTCCCQNGGRVGVARGGGFGDAGGGDLGGVAVSPGENEPVRLLSLEFLHSVLLCGGGDRPAGGDELELAQRDFETLRVRDSKVPDLGCSETGAAVDAIVDDECAADAAADGDVKEG